MSTPAVGHAAGFAVEAAGPVATITFNRTERLNSQDPHTWAGLGPADRPSVPRCADRRA